MYELCTCKNPACWDEPKPLFGKGLRSTHAQTLEGKALRAEPTHADTKLTHTQAESVGDGWSCCESQSAVAAGLISPLSVTGEYFCDDRCMEVGWLHGWQSSWDQTSSTLRDGPRPPSCAGSTWDVWITWQNLHWISLKHRHIRV